MEAMPGISLYSYLHLKLAKTICLSFLLCFLSTKSEKKRTKQDLPGSRGWRWGLGMGEEVAQTMYTHVSKCKDDKIRGEKKKKQICFVVSIKCKRT
jgi:hypothetical protein